ncbi:hypothetical protein AAY473_009690 [Plecturocebus cupreus]
MVKPCLYEKNTEISQTKSHSCSSCWSAVARCQLIATSPSWVQDFKNLPKEKHLLRSNLSQFHVDQKSKRLSQQKSLQD